MDASDRQERISQGRTPLSATVSDKREKEALSLDRVDTDIWRPRLSRFFQETIKPETGRVRSPTAEEDLEKLLRRVLVLSSIESSEG